MALHSFHALSYVSIPQSWQMHGHFFGEGDGVGDGDGDGEGDTGTTGVKPERQQLKPSPMSVEQLLSSHRSALSMLEHSS